MSSRNNWRGKMLVDLSTESISIDRCNDRTSDNASHNSDFLPPHNSSLINTRFPHLIGLTEQEQPELISNNDTEKSHASSEYSHIESYEPQVESMNPTTPIPEEMEYEQSGFNEKTLNNYDNMESSQHESENRITVSSTVVAETAQDPLVNETMGKPESEIDTNTSKFYLNEETGMFVATFKEIVQNKSFSNFKLDDRTGELIEMEQSEYNEIDDELEKVLEKKKNRKFNKNQRVKGKCYMGRKLRENTEDQNKRVVSFVTKGKKQVKTKGCTHEVTEGKSSRSYLCGKISEEQRQSIFDFFWNLESWVAKKAYLKNLILIRPIKRRRQNTNLRSTKKKQGYDCLLPYDNNELVKVCKKFLLNTLDMNNETILQWVKSLNEDSQQSVDDSDPGHSGLSDSIKKIIIKQWLDLLPKVPSHYCRSSSNRVYVEDTFRNKSHMHRVHRQWCNENNKEAARRKLFCTVLKREKISIFKPRKDTCTAYKENNLTVEEYQLHQQMKQEAYNAKEEANLMCSSEVLVVTMDVQGILLSPKLQVSAQYYKTKLQLHNFTLYLNNNKEVHLYVWHEGDGGVTANEFVSCILDFINSKLNENYKKIILISDGCSYQNRNKILASALCNLTKQRDIEIQQTILEKGHTMMQVDSVHSTLEQLFKPPIFSPNDYIHCMSQARPAKPYIIHHLDYTFFKDFEKTCLLDSIRPGKKTGDPVVTDIRGLLYKNGQIFYKLRHPHDWKLLPQRMCAGQPVPKQLYTMTRKIEKSKYDSLQSLKNYMHRDYHCFYDSLQHY